jgi:hypothetical protein
VIEGANLVFFPPPSPILQFFRSFGDRLFADLDIHEVFPSGVLLISQWQIRRPLSTQYCTERRCFIKRGASSPL